MTHNLLLVGPPGSGKTFQTRWLAASVPDFEPGDVYHVRLAWIYSAARLLGYGFDLKQIQKPPFRAPHHTISQACLVGARGRPGEVNLASYGTLMLDELPEFRLGAIRALADALKRAWCSGAPASPHYLVCTANPCPCGWHGHRRCDCTEAQVDRYQDHLRRFFQILGGGDILHMGKGDPT